MAVNLRKVTAIKNKSMIDDGNNHTKNGSEQFLMLGTIFILF